MNIIHEIIMLIVRKIDIKDVSLKIELNLKLNVKDEIYLLILINDIQYSKLFKTLNINV